MSSTAVDDSSGFELEEPCAELLPGQKLGRFEIVGAVGGGGMGLVYRARDPRLKRDVAIKVLRGAAGSYRDPQKAQTRLLREAQAMARVAHPNVVHVHEVSSQEDVVYVVMELVDGGTLADWLSGASRSWKEVLRAFIDAGQGLAAAHGAGLVHRDFKPSNVLVGVDGRVRVTDFGLVSGAQPAEEEDEPPEGTPSAVSLSLTRSGVALGTPAYMSPEQHSGAEADARSDQFSFCVALFEALYGHRPFSGKSRAEVERSILDGRIDSPVSHGDVPRSVHRIVLRGLSEEPGLRYPNMDALLGEFGRVQRGPRRTWLWAVVAAVLSAGATVALVTSGADGRTESAEPPPPVETRPEQQKPPASQPPSPSRPVAKPAPVEPKPAPSPKARGPAHASPPPTPAPSATPREEQSDKVRRQLLLEE